MEESTIEKIYNPKDVEKKWYQKWKDQKCFTPRQGDQPAFSLIMPPPNVTGRLHMGHALDNICQDILIRYKRMKGFRTLWIPGVDHAGIATQSVVEKKLYKEQKIKRNDIGRDEFLKHVWQWKEEHMHEIIQQLEQLGVSCDWDYLTFTMDSIPNKAVRKFFVDLYNQGLIYQAEKIINWDTTLQSAISDAEVESKEVKGKFYYIQYQIEGSDDTLTIATTRPETLFGDTAVAVNPKDERFSQYIGSYAILPLTDRKIPIIGDEYVELELGTGCLKVTPGHDFNDFEIGKRHQLPIINILNKDGTFNENAAAIQGLNVQQGRKKTIELLEEKKLLIKVEDRLQMVGHGERSDSIIEPMVSQQWFLNVSDMANKAVKAVENSDMKFFPKGWENTYFSWLREPKDWCISRQLWWGHQIPIYQCQSCQHQWASEQDPSACPNCQASEFTQDPDVLDTWFSSALWPLSTLGWPDQETMKQKDFESFFPTHTLVTGFDIIFFWVARMMMSSLSITNQVPFKHTYIHGIVRDKQGRKMSKSLGNGIDPLETIDQYGCDAVRFTLAAGAGYNRGLNLDPAKIEGYRNFVNKLWNAFRFLSPHLKNTDSNQIENITSLNSEEKWILEELNQVIEQVSHSIEDYRFDDASSALYRFIYDQYCSWFIELSKPILFSDDDKAKGQRLQVLTLVLKDILKLIHPITPFVSEEIYSHLSKNQMLISEKYPEVRAEFNFPDDRFKMNQLIEMVTQIRNLRASLNLKPKDEIKAQFFTDNQEVAQFFYQQKIALKDLAGIVAATISSKASKRPGKSSAVATDQVEAYVQLEGLIDLKKEQERLQKKIDHLLKEQQKFQAKLDNPKFSENAPEEVINEVKEKLNHSTLKINSLKAALNNLD